MPGKLIVLVRVEKLGGWSIVAAGVDAAEAQDRIAAFLTLNPSGRAAVAQVLRSFTATTAVVEDPIAVVEP